MIEDNTFLVECKGSVMHVTMSRPEVLNALHQEVHLFLDATFNRFAEDKELRIATITGSDDRSFCTGTELKVLMEKGSDLLPGTGFSGLTERFDLTKPVVALINGDAIGGGLKIVLACYLAIAVVYVRYGLPEPRIGLAAKNKLHRLAHQIPMKHVMQIALTGKLFDARTVLEYGLINPAVGKKSFERENQHMLGDLLKYAPLSHRATKQMDHQGLEEIPVKLPRA